MAIFQQNLPASLRLGSSAAPENRGIPATDRRPYLVTVPPRKTVVPAQGRITDLAWTPDNRHLIYCSSGQAYRVSAQTDRKSVV